MNKLINKLFFLLVGFLLTMAVVVIAILWAFSNKLPDYKFLKSYKPPVSSKVYAGEGQLVSDFSREKRIFVPYDSIPLKVINSFYQLKIKIFFLIQGLMQKELLELL